MVIVFPDISSRTKSVVGGVVLAVAYEVRLGDISRKLANGAAETDRNPGAVGSFFSENKEV